MTQDSDASIEAGSVPLPDIKAQEIQELVKDLPKHMVPPEFNAINVYNSARLCMPLQELAEIYDVSKAHLMAVYGPQIRAGRNLTKSLLREKQLEQAINGERTMLMWLGKNILQQSDNPIPETVEKDGMVFKVSLIPMPTGTATTDNVVSIDAAKKE
ncbi:MAG TPA: hypothetical protein VII99_13140 [Bacteroidia bacterium]